MSDNTFVEKLKEVCTNQPGIVVYIGPNGEELILIESTLHDRVKMKLLKQVKDYMQSNFELFFDQALDEWRHQNAKKTEEPQ